MTDLVFWRFFEGWSGVLVSLLLARHSKPNQRRYGTMETTHLIWILRVETDDGDTLTDL